MDVYKLSRNWFDYCFDHPDEIKPVHTALYFFCIEHCNRLGWKEKFGLPTTMAKEAIGIHSYNTYITTLNDLIKWGFIILVQKSVNQYSSNIIALSKNNKATDKALDKALVKHTSKHSIKQSESTVQSTVQSIDSIDLQYTNLQSTNLQDTSKDVCDVKSLAEISNKEKKEKKRNEPDFIQQILDAFCEAYVRSNLQNYEVVSPGKERKAIGQILALHKKKHPNLSSEETLDGLKKYFELCCGISDRWLKQNMSPSIIVSKFNEINKILRNDTGISAKEYLDAAAERYARGE